MVFRVILGTALAGVLAAGSARAQTIVDGGFEATNVPAGSAPGYAIGSTAIPGWTVINHDSTTQTATNNRDIAVLGNGAFGLSTPFGIDFVDLTGYNDNPAYAGVGQTITTSIGQAYNLTFWLGASLTDGRYAGPVSALVYFGAQTATAFNTGPSNLTATNMIWTMQNVVFTARTTSTLVGIVGNSSTGGQFIGLDNVSIAPVAGGGVPEPASWAMMLAGFGAMGLAMRRRRKVAATVSYAA